MKEKENQKTAVCPTCGCEHPIKNEGYLFKEEWEVALSNFGNRQCGITGLHQRDDGSLSESYYDGWRPRRRILSPVPREITDWLNANPCPRLNREQFIHSLGVRIAALEKKGGAK